MSINWGIGDLLSVAKLAWDLYDNCYRVAREAPDDFRQLVTELGALQSVLKNLRDDINSDKSYIKRLDPDRKESLERFLKSCFDTLRKLQALVVYFKELGIGDGLQFWKRLKWVSKKTTITELKSQIVAHNVRISLCMSEIGNSSLARIENRIDQALNRQDFSNEDEDTVSLLRNTTVSGRSDPGEAEPTLLRRQYTSSTLVPDRLTAMSIDSPPSTSDDSEFGLVSPSKPQRKLSALTKKFQPTSSPSATLWSPPSPVASDDGLALQYKSRHTSSASKETSEGDTDLRAVLDSAMVELGRIRQKERQARPLKIPDQNSIPHPDQKLISEFEQSVTMELEYRKLNTKDWLRAGTWWLLKATHNLQIIERLNDGGERRGSLASTSFEKLRGQAYVDLLKASWILQDQILKSDYVIPMQADDNRKLYLELLEGIKREFKEFRYDIPTEKILHSSDLNRDIWEDMQAEEDSFEQDLFDLDNGRWITVEQGDAGQLNEKVLFRTFVDAAIGGRGRRVHSKGTPYMILLSVQNGESEPKVTLANQSGTLGLSRDFTIDDLEQFSPPTSPIVGMDRSLKVDAIQLEFGAMETQVVFTSDPELQSFMHIPRTYFNAVQRREPRQLPKATETLLYDSAIEIMEELNPSTLKIVSRKHKFESCNLRILETNCKEAWRTTRRLVLSSSAGEKQPWCKEFFLPMDRVQLNQDATREIRIKFSDCSQEDFRPNGNFSMSFSYVYDDTKPNRAYTFLFRHNADAAEFKKTILSLPIPPTFAWQNEEDESGAIYEVADTDPKPKKYKAIMLTRTRLDWTYSQLFYTYRDTDYRHDTLLRAVNFPQLYYSDYISGHIEEHWKPERPAQFSECVKKVNQLTIEFPDETVVHDFMSALSEQHKLIFSCRASHITTKAPSLWRGVSKSNKGPAEIQLWRKGNSMRMVSRWGDVVNEKWISLPVTEKSVTYSNNSNRVSFLECVYSRGRNINMEDLVAVRPKEKTGSEKKGALTITFSVPSDQERFVGMIEGRRAVMSVWEEIGKLED